MITSPGLPRLSTRTRTAIVQKPGWRARQQVDSLHQVDHRHHPHQPRHLQPNPKHFQPIQIFQWVNSTCGREATTSRQPGNIVILEDIGNILILAILLSLKILDNAMEPGLKIFPSRVSAFCRVTLPDGAVNVVSLHQYHWDGQRWWWWWWWWQGWGVALSGGSVNAMGTQLWGVLLKDWIFKSPTSW